MICDGAAPANAPSTSTQYYYSAAWQVIHEDSQSKDGLGVTSSSCDNVWSLAYVDAMAFQGRSASVQH